jgi:hypothetical protein
LAIMSSDFFRLPLWIRNKTTRSKTNGQNLCVHQ